MIAMLSYCRLHSFHYETLQGRVVANLTNAGISGAQIEAIPGPGTALSSPSGDFVLVIPVSTRAITVSATGFSTLTLPAQEGSKPFITLKADPATTLEQLIQWEAKGQWGAAWMLVHPDAYAYVTRAQFIANEQLVASHGYLPISVRVQGYKIQSWRRPPCPNGQLSAKIYPRAALLRVTYTIRTPRGRRSTQTQTYLVESSDGLWRFFPREGCLTSSSSITV